MVQKIKAFIRKLLGKAEAYSVQIEAAEDKFEDQVRKVSPEAADALDKATDSAVAAAHAAEAKAETALGE